MSQRQFVVALLIVATTCALLWIIAHVVLDLIRFVISRFTQGGSFVPRSWLIVLAVSLWSVLVPSRGEVAGATPTFILEDSEGRTVNHDSNNLISLLSCSIVVAGLIFDIGKSRGSQLRQLQLNSKLNHPSATAVRTEVALRAMLEANPVDDLVSYQSANSEIPIYVPLGICDSQIVFVDIGKGSVINVCVGDTRVTSSIFNALMAATMFAGQSQAKPILLATSSAEHIAFSAITTVSTTQEAIKVVTSSAQHCVVFTTAQIDDSAIDLLIASGAAVVCASRTLSATALLQICDHMWRLSPNEISLVPYGLLTNEVDAIKELLIDVGRSLQPDLSQITKESHHSIEKWNVMVRILGPVDVQLLDGSVIEFEKSKTKELLAWLTSHRSRPTRSAARTALWEVNVADATFTNIVSDARRTLNQTNLISSTEEWLPRTFNDQLPFHISIISDGEILESCIARAQELEPSQAIDELHRGLELVRDLPFAGTGYLWPDAEGITSQLVLNVITASAMAGELDLRRGEIEGVFWATAKGLQVLGAHEELIALRMRAHALRGDLAGVRGEWQSYQRIVKSDSWSNGQPSAKLVNLYGRLNSGVAVSLSR
ncbi:MAG: hypothetical protein HQ486_03320 [Acidimicrobiaceae bacterium]|nr:hypothetical protein [Acidimicrobiaceae bacterium]